jgi:8-oxo-dGTP diphosphatase
VDSQNIYLKLFKRQYVGCIILTQDLKILLQLRTVDKSFPGAVSTFGGKIESGEEPMAALIRELDEELGAKVNEAEVVFLGIITEAITNYTELLHVYFWHDRLGTITGCYEGNPLYFADLASIKNNQQVMDYVHWQLKECILRGLLSK